MFEWNKLFIVPSTWIGLNWREWSVRRALDGSAECGIVFFSDASHWPGAHRRWWWRRPWPECPAPLWPRPSFHVIYSGGSWCWRDWTATRQVNLRSPADWVEIGDHWADSSWLSGDKRRHHSASRPWPRCKWPLKLCSTIFRFTTRYIEHNLSLGSFVLGVFQSNSDQSIKLDKLSSAQWSDQPLGRNFI